MISTILFVISLIFLSTMLFSKWQEEKSGNKNFVGRGLASVDPFAVRINSAANFRWQQVSQTVRYIIFIVIPRRSEESWREAKKMAVQGYKKQKDILMGKRDIANGSSASFYLKKIKEDQANGADGRIEDENI